MFRIINPASPRPGYRFPLAALGGSLLLHLLMLDLLLPRPATVDRAGRDSGLRARLQLPEAVVEVGNQVRKRELPVTGHRTPAVARTQPEGAMKSADQAEPRGFRPLTSEEAMVAYRIALASVLQPDWPALESALRIGLAFDAGGQLRSVELLQGSGRPLADEEWLAMTARAVGKRPPPPELATRAFRLELEIMP